jgi:hypothetical protein
VVSLIIELKTPSTDMKVLVFEGERPHAPETA